MCKEKYIYLTIGLSLVALVSLFVLTACTKTTTHPKKTNAKYIHLKNLSGNKDLQKFSNVYWETPMNEGIHSYNRTKLQGITSSSSCMLCHYKQYERWKKSRMAHSMDAGVVGQLLLKKMTSKHWKTWVNSCLSCHSPFAEYYVKNNSQYNGLNKKEKNILKNGTKAGKALVIALNALNIPMKNGASSVGCSTCHVRYFHKFGPPLKKYRKQSNMAHIGFVPTKAFLNSYFCITCHELPRNNRRLNGKLFENTYGEWKKSTYSKKDVSCETCHTPRGQMTFKSIYNKNFVLKALTIRLKKIKIYNGRINTTLSVTNSGVGHNFPTYTTPKVILSIAQEKAGGNIIDKSTKHYTIGWSVSLNLKKQYFDTRLKPFQTAKLNYNYPLFHNAKYIKAWITVKPESHYAKFFEAYLKIKQLPKIIRILFLKALKEDKNSQYLLWKQQVNMH